jgi:GR25 family glycosyltransferase involved in LPS biosynthesis
MFSFILFLHICVFILHLKWGNAFEPIDVLNFFMFPSPYLDEQKWWMENNPVPFQDTVFPLEATIITTEQRKRFSSRVEFYLNDNFIPYQKVMGANPKDIDFEAYFPYMNEKYLSFWLAHLPVLGKDRGMETVDQRGHFSCTLAHRRALRNMIRFPHLVVEDDAEFVFNFGPRIQSILHHLPKDWEILVVGFSSEVKHTKKAKLNDGQPVRIPGFARIYHFIGGYAYIIRNMNVKMKIMRFMKTLDWHFDIHLSQLVQMGYVVAYGCIPNLIVHPGRLRISAFNHDTMGDLKFFRSDTNVKKIDPDNRYADLDVSKYTSCSV